MRKQISACGINKVLCFSTIERFFFWKGSLSLLLLSSLHLTLLPLSSGQHTETVDFSFNALADPRFTFHDHALVEAVKLENPEVHAFFKLLALCHTVMAEEKKEGEVNTVGSTAQVWISDALEISSFTRL